MIYKGRILIIDDEKSLTELMKIRFEANKYEVFTANSGEDGIKIALKEKPDVVLLDIMMPEMDGYEVLKHLRHNPTTSGIPVIMCSARGETKSLVRAFDLLSTDYIIKPFDFKELLEIVERNMEK